MLSIRWWHYQQLWHDDMMTRWHEDRKLRRRLTVWYIYFLTLPYTTALTETSSRKWLEPSDRDNSWFQFQQAFKLKRYRGFIPYLLFANIYKIIKSTKYLHLKSYHCVKTLLLAGTSLPHAALASIKNYFATNEETITRAIRIVL